MNKLLMIIVCLVYTNIQSISQTIVKEDYYINNPSLSGDVVIKSKTVTTNGEKIFTSFAVNSPAAGEYYMSFWMCPYKLSNGSYSEYSVSVNGIVLMDRIKPQCGDWQSASLSQCTPVKLNKGDNTISVIGIAPDVPSVEHVKVSRNPLSTEINDSVYKCFKSELIANSTIENIQGIRNLESSTKDTLSSEAMNIASDEASDEAPPYNYDCILDLNINYTFYKVLSFSKGEQVSITTEGVEDFEHVLEMFSASKPETYSWAAMSNSVCAASLNITIPEAGLYYVKVRSFLNARSGLCNLNINNEFFYENIPVYSFGVRYLQDTDKIYNTFTCYNTGDPVLWIEEGMSIPGKISAYNNDYGVDSDYLWGNNARIAKQYPRPVHAVLLSTASSYYPTTKCDLYIGCESGSLIPFFPSLKESDAIAAAPASPVYNCISWSGGIASYWEWPPEPLSSYYSPNPLTAFDNFYASRGLTRNGATPSNSVVDLWATIEPNSNLSYKHASVRKGADDNSHGYDWESKLGPLERIFHPRYVLENNLGYGSVTENYRKIDNTTTLTTLEEEIADGISKIEYVNFTEQEKSFIDSNVRKINNDLMLHFDSLYIKWKSVFSHSVYSDPAKIADCNEYRSLLNLCSVNKELLYVVFQHLGIGDIAAIRLVEDLTLRENLHILRAVRMDCARKKNDAGVNVVRPILSNAIDYVKRIISAENTKFVKAKSDTAPDVTYSNSKKFNASAASKNVVVDFSLTERSVVSLSLLDLAGNVISTALCDAVLEEGVHTHNLSVGKGNIYLIRLIINGQVNIKKIYYTHN